MFHPALLLLLRAQANAKWRRMRQAFSRGRRFSLSILASVLALFWCGNLVISVLLREQTPPELFAKRVAAGLFVYALWHVIKPAFARPAEPIEWTEAERELLCAGPFRRHELVFFRLACILNATLLKTACFTLLMLPDLRQPLAGFLGTLLALVFLDLWRVNIEIAVHGISLSSYRRFRAATAVICGAVLVSSLVIAFVQPPTWSPDSTHLTWAIMRHVLGSAAELFETLPGRIAVSPFQWFTYLMTREHLTWGWAFQILCGLGLVATLAALMVVSDRWFDRRTRAREQNEYPPQAKSAESQSPLQRKSDPRHIAWLGGAGPIVWRQLLGANRQGSQLAIALALPGLLATLPILVCPSPTKAALQVAAAVTFYSFLLLPTALKFDFRRDLDRMVILKALPIRPIAIVIGQIMAPTILAFLFQATVLGITMCVRPFPVRILCVTLLLLGPLNALIFVLDNLIFLLFPYRLNQEGIEIFLRTTLTFTAKGLIFALGLALTVAWVFGAGQIASRLPVGFQDTALIFVLGGWIILCAATMAAVHMLARAFIRFDPSQDIPA